jgi:G3E family GTPase
VVETSGVTDPLRIIKTLDAKFGKMYRARLDSVVTVIDADQFLNGWVGKDCDPLAPPPLPSAAAHSQVTAADVILLNKVDLLSEEEQAKAEAVVRNPNLTLTVSLTSTLPLRQKQSCASQTLTLTLRQKQVAQP